MAGRKITLTVRLLDENQDEATLHLNTGSSTWDKTENGGASKVYKTKGGGFQVLGGDAVILNGSAGTASRVGRFTALDPTKVKAKDQGSGLSDEAGIAVSWVCTKVL